MEQGNNRWFIPLALSLFFLNSAFLDGRLSLVLLLTPIWIYLAQPSKAGLYPGIFITTLVLISFAAIHFYKGIESIPSYIISFSVLLSILLFINAVIHYVTINSHLLDLIFRRILVINTLLVLLSLVVLHVSELREYLWYVMAISEGIEPFPRLKLFTPEASHYAFLFAPVCIYFLLRLVLFNVRPWFFTFLLATIPMVLSFSLGVMAALFLSGIIVFFWKYGNVFRQYISPSHILVFLTIAVVGAVIMYFFWPDNPLYVRLENLMEGKDTSGRGRTYEAFILADRIIQERSDLWGIGPGQLKILGRETIIQFYQYTNIPAVIRIPNASAETIAWFGYVGFFLRIALQVYLFLRTRVRYNVFRLWLFVFLFLYQFTGSYITNSSEYLLWVLVFLPVFPDFNIKKIQKV